MISIFETFDYKVFFNKWVAAQPKNGHGEYLRLAKHLGVSTTLISQVFNGDKHPSLEMAIEISEYLGLGTNESDFFLLQVEFAKAGSTKLRDKFKRQLTNAQERAKKIENRVKRDMVLSPEAQSIYYSNWQYSGVRLMSAIPEYSSVAAIAAKLNLPRSSVQKIVDFMLQNGLIKDSGGKLQISSTSTHIGSSSPLVSRHHQNWRLLGFQKMIQDNEQNMFYTGPVALSAEAAVEIQKIINRFIDEYHKICVPSESEQVRCLNIDWFEC